MQRKKSAGVDIKMTFPPKKIRQKGGFCLLFDRLANALAAVGLKNNDDPAVFIDFIINNSIRVYPDFAFSPQPVP